MSETVIALYANKIHGKKPRNPFSDTEKYKKVNHLGIQNEDLAKSSFTQIIQFDYLRKSFIATFSILILNHHLNYWVYYQSKTNLKKASVTLNLVDMI